MLVYNPRFSQPVMTRINELPYSFMFDSWLILLCWMQVLIKTILSLGIFIFFLFSYLHFDCIVSNNMSLCFRCSLSHSTSASPNHCLFPQGWKKFNYLWHLCSCFKPVCNWPFDYKNSWRSMVMRNLNILCDCINIVSFGKHVKKPYCVVLECVCGGGSSA